MTSAATAARTTPDLPPRRLQLVQAGELLTEIRMISAREYLLGSGEAADLKIDHKSVAGAHARIYSSEGEVFLEDLGTDAGTFVEGRRVEGAQRLRHRQQILLGQHTVVKPIVVRFEDPSVGILEEMGLAPRLAPVQEQVVPGAPSQVAEEAAAPTPTRQAGLARLRNPRVLAAGLVALVALGLAIWGLLEVLRPSSAVWRSVQISPTALTAGEELVLQSPDIHPRDRLGVFLANEPAKILERRRGRLVVEVPELAGRSGGSHDVPLVARRRKVEIYQRMITYVVQPVVEAVQPRSIEVGGTLTIRGKGFSAEKSDIKIQLGEHTLIPVSATASELVAQVPVVTRAEIRRLPLEVSVGDWVTNAPELLQVRPRASRPLRFELSAKYQAERRAWLVSHSLGPAFYLAATGAEAEAPVVEADETADTAEPAEIAETAEAAEPTEPAQEAGPAELAEPAEAAETEEGDPASFAPVDPPAEIEALLEGWRRLFLLAAEDPDVRIDVAAANGAFELVGRGGSLEKDLPLARWQDDELLNLVAPERKDLSSEMVCYWMAGVWNSFLNVFSRGQHLSEFEDSPQYVGVLNHLVEANVQGGGQGRPEQLEIDGLPASERALLAQAFLPVPQGVGSVSGRWQAVLENVFFDDLDYRIFLDIDLRQRHGRLSGGSTVSMRTSRMSWSLPKASLGGQLWLDVPPRLRILVDFPKPIGRLVLEGQFNDASLDGTFTAAGGATGRWQAVRVGKGG